MASLGLFSWNNLQAQPGSALRLDGTGDFVTISSSGQNNITGTAITLEAWIYPTSWKTNYYDGSIVVKEGHFSGYILSCGNSGQLSFNIPDGGNHNTLNSSTGVLSLNKWQHVAATYDGATMRLFVNGVQVGTRGSSSAIVTTANSLMIGASAHAANREFAGRIDEVRIWNSTRTPDQLLDGMHRELAGSESGLAAYYRMSNGSGTTLTDNVSSGGTNGTISNAVWMTSTARLASAATALRYRAAGTGLDFDGTNDYVSVADANALDLTKNFTLEAWVHPTSLGSGYSRILGKSGAYGLGINNANIRFSTYGVQNYDLAYAVPTGQWTHIALVMNNTDDALFYVNGILRGTVDGTVSAEISGDALWIGASSNGGGEEYFNGRIDEVRIWNTPRTATQIQDNLLRVVDPASANLVATYRFDEALGTSLTDATSNALNGTLTNMTNDDWVSSAGRDALKVWQANGLWHVDSTYVLGTAPSTSISNTQWIEATQNLAMNSSTTAAYAGNFFTPTGSTVSNTSSNTLNINGNLINNGTMTTTTGGMRFQGTGEKAFIAGSGTTTHAVFTVSATNGLAMQKSITATTLYVESLTGFLEIGSNTLTIAANGTIIGQSITGGSTSNLTILGTAGAQVFLPGLTLNNLTINRTNGMRLVGALRIEGTLTLTRGKVDLNLNNLTFGPSASVTSPGFSNIRYIDASSAKVVKEFTTTGSFLYPVGDLSNYSPITLNFTSGTFGSGANATVQVYNNLHPNNESPNVYIERYWQVEQTNISGFSCAVEATYLETDVNEASGLKTEADLNGAKWDGVAWTIFEDVDITTNKITARVSSFSDFTAGEEETFALLPVELVSFTAEPRADVIDLSWATLNEQNSEYFQVQRSADGNRFTTIGQLAAAGNSSTLRDYAFTDASPLEGTAYYRLRQTDIDGQVHFSNTVEVSLRGGRIDIFPNPATDGFWVSLPEDIVGSLFITTAMGRLVKSVRLEGGKQYIDVSNLPSGVYYGAFKLRGMKGSVEKIVIK